MIKLYHKTLSFGRVKRQIIEGNFNSGTLSSDGGMVLLDILPDKQDQNKITHLHRDLISQRLYALCCGYEDISDHNDLRKDFLLQRPLLID